MTGQFWLGFAILIGSGITVMSAKRWPISAWPVYLYLIGVALLVGLYGAYGLAPNYPRALANVLVSEGGFTNDRRDPGGPTNFGITIHDARLYGAEFSWKANPTTDDVRHMPMAFVEKVYRLKYADVVHFDEMPPGLDYTLFDYAVNSGVGRAAKVLRRILDIPADTRVTAAVIAEVNRRDAKVLIRSINDERLRFLKSLRTWNAFGGGWSRRVASVRSISLSMASGARQGAGAEFRPAFGPHKAFEETEEPMP